MSGLFSFEGDSSTFEDVANELYERLPVLLKRECVVSGAVLEWRLRDIPVVHIQCYKEAIWVWRSSVWRSEETVWTTFLHPFDWKAIAKTIAGGIEFWDLDLLERLALLSTNTIRLVQDYPRDALSRRIMRHVGGNGGTSF